VWRMEEAKSGTSRRGKNENLLIRKFRNELPPSSTGFSECVNGFSFTLFFCRERYRQWFALPAHAFMPKPFFFDI